MNCNQKRSKPLKTVYLAQGKKHIEQFARGGSLRAQQDNDLLGEEAADEASVLRGGGGEARASFLPPLVGSRYPLELSGGHIDRKLGNTRTEDLSLVHLVKQEPRDDVPVEILGGPEAEGVRTDLDEQVTECSSSFGYTDSSFEGGDERFDNSEVQSNARDEDGGAASQPEPQADPRERSKKPLNVHWKNYRRGIEWRCRWLNLRLMELKRQAAKYDRAYSSLQQTKRLQVSAQSDVGVSRACPLPEEHKSRHLVYRRKRRKVEETADVSSYMTAHPLFSRYEKRKREAESSKPENKHQLDKQFEPTSVVNFARLKQEERETREAAEEPDSLEQIMWKVETLHTRVIRLRNQLKASMSRLSTQPARATTARVQTPKTGARSTIGTPKGSQAVRRRASDFDINNMVMPVSVGTVKHVEHIKHSKIETPQWRIVEGAGTAEQNENSSEEDTDDEIYRVRHGPLEIQERRVRYVPRAIKKTSDADVAAWK